MAGITIDLILLVLILLSVLFGVLRGFSRELLSLFVWGLSACFSIVYAKSLLHEFAGIFPAGDIGLVLAFATLFVLAFFMLSIVSYLIARMIRKSALRGADLALGGLFGLLRGFVIVVLLVWLLDTLVPALQNNADWQGSMLVFYFSQVPEWVMEQDVSNLLENGRQWVNNTIHRER